ncbi:MAG: hypothetical protein CL608_18670 [Anaerolineaceae bacterium]|nr:hypothetical protein [Anaerolineaceae bacterium]
MIRLSIRHLLRHWRMNFIVLLGLVLAAAFLAGLPTYATAIAGRSLRQQIDSAIVSARNIEATGTGLNAAVYGQLQEYLGDLLLRRVEVQTVAPTSITSALYRDEVPLPFAEFFRYQPWTFSNLNQDVTVVDGRFPSHIEPEPNSFVTEIEAVVGVASIENLTFDQSAGETFQVETLQVGDQLRNNDGSFRINIVGVVQPNDPESDVWWGELRPFEFERASLNGPNSPETVTLAMIIPQQTMEQVFADRRQRSWRVLIDSSKITVNNVDQVQTNLSNVSSDLRIELETGLLLIINEYQTALANAQVTLFLLTVQSLIFVLYTVAMISSFLLDQSRGVLATLVGRGFNGRQITQLFAIQGFLLAILAAALGPLAARGLLTLWGSATNTIVPSALAQESWQLSLVAAGFSWLTLVVAIYGGTQGNILDWQKQLARPPSQAGWQKYYIDIFLLVLGGLIYWQLRDTGTVVAQLAQNEALAAAGVSDPLLLLGPSLLLIAVALIFLRIFPYLLRLASWWANRVRGLILPFGLAKLSRDPVGPSRVVLLISLAAGLTLFASLFDHSLSVRQAQIAHYNTGADMRVRLPIDAGSAEFEAVADLPGVQWASPVYYNGRSRLSTNLGQQVEMLAVDPVTLPQVSRYAPFISGVTLAEVMPAVQGIGTDGAIPAVFSASAPPNNKEIGDHIQYVVGTHRVTFEVRGIIGHFPLLGDRFFITNLAAVEQAVNLPTLSEPWVGQREVWLAVEPGQSEAVVDQIANGSGPFGSQVLASAESTEELLRSNLVAQETLGAFELNAITLAALSVAVFLLVHFFAARQRLYEFSLLRATGMATRQLLGLLTLEGLIMMVLGLLAGSGIGAGLALIMRPFLSRVLSTAVGGDAIQQILVNWTEVFSLYGLLIGFYGLALLLLLFFLVRAGIHRALRIGEE